MDAKQVIEQLFAMGPVGWSGVVLISIVMLWGLIKQAREGSFPGTLIFGIGAMVLLSTCVMGFAMYLERSPVKNPHGKSDTKIGIEQKERR